MPKLVVFNLIILSICSSTTIAWFTCSETFCSKLRHSEKTAYELNFDTLKIYEHGIEIKFTTNRHTLKLNALQKETFQLEIVENSANHYREEAVLEKLEFLNIEVNKTSNEIKVGKKNYNDYAIISLAPFKIQFFNGGLMSIINFQNKMVFDNEIALDVTFPNTQRAYGLPQHADHLALRSTSRNDLDPYRLYNLDYANYKIESTEALYGSVAVLYAHGVTHSSGVFWLNPSQTWIDTDISVNQVSAYFMSEIGNIQMFILTGPTLQKTVQQYAKLTGVAPLPQLFSLGYHQSRYSYMTQDEVIAVANELHANYFPVDVLWLDIDYTDNYKYFTWDQNRFPKPLELQKSLNSLGIKLVTIIDPHFQVNESYFLYKEAVQNNYFVKKEDGNDFIGQCWPGWSSYLDFLNPDVRNYYSQLFSKDTFNASNVHIWNDMNEPSVFGVPEFENTMTPTLLHKSNTVQHKQIHNVYGYYQTMGTHKGLRKISEKGRPFILTRSHFAGIQRYAAIWTGDNAATWDYLQISFPMCLTEALAGVSFCGADVGGFNDFPDEELMQRWYQAGAWLPFYRAHSAINAPRREPYLYPQKIQQRLRNALNERYAHLPVWYTVFREHELSGEPVIRPIIYQYPTDADALSIENQLLLGSNILVAPVFHQGITILPVYLPGDDCELWFNINEGYKQYNGNGYRNIFVTIDSIPVFYRGGSIIPRKDNPTLTTTAMKNEPFTLYISLNEDQTAEGTLYVDDYTSFEYKNDKYLYLHFTFENNTIISHKLTNTSYSTTERIDKIVIINYQQRISNVSFIDEYNSGWEIQISHQEESNIVRLENLDIDVKKPFTIQINNSGSKLTMSYKYFILLIITILTCKVMFNY